MMQHQLDKKRGHIETSIAKMAKNAKSKRKTKQGDHKKMQQMASRKKKLLQMGFDKTEDGKRWKLSEMGYRPGSIQEGGGHKQGWTYKVKSALSRKEYVPSKTAHNGLARSLCSEARGYERY